MKTISCVLAAGLLAGASACAGSGLGKAVRTDITATMAKAESPLAACYAARLKVNRRLKGTITVSAVAEPLTGKLTEVKIRHDEIGDPDLADCVVAEVSKLTLEKPVKSKVAFDYPIAFAPTK